MSRAKKIVGRIARATGRSLDAVGHAIDRSLVPFFPGYAVSRMKSRAVCRQLSTYAAAEKSRVTRDWKASPKTADEAILPDLVTITARARQMVRDDAYAVSVVNSFGRNVVGKGITPAACVRTGSSGRPRTRFNDEATALFMRWANTPEACDHEGTKTFWMMQRLAAEQLVEAGEILFVLNVRDNGRDLPDLRLQAVEPEQFDTSKVTERSTGNAIVGGIELDGDGRAVAYHFHPMTVAPGSGVTSIDTRSSVRIKRDDVIHLFIPRRAAQKRGISALSPVLRRLRSLGEYDDTQLWVARMEACVGLLIKRQNAGVAGGAIGLRPSEGADGDGNREITFQPGMIAELNEGEDVTPFTPSRPGGQYEPFVKAQLRAVAAGSDLSYAQVARDFHDGNFSSQRQAKLEDQRAWEPIQEFFISTLCRRTWERFIQHAAIKGLFASGPSSIADIPRFLACEWMPQGWDWIDPVKEVTAATKAIDYRLTTRQRILNDQGRSYRETFRQIADEKNEAAELGFALPEDAVAAPPDEEAGEPEDDEDKKPDPE